MTLLEESPLTPAGLPFAVAPPLPHIREYREEDADELARMWRESAPAWNGEGPFNGTLSTGAFVRQQHKDIDTLAVFTAWLPDQKDGSPRAVGYLSLYEQPTEIGTAYVGILSAHPGWHGTGVGRDLLKAALDRSVRLGYHRLDLHTWPGNMKAVPLYKKSGYVWVPDTSVKMENYLPAIFRLGPAQRFFREADWYADFKRDLTPKEDDEKRDGAGVYTYAWERDGKRLVVTIDRKAKSVVSLETERYAVSIRMDDPKLVVGGERRALWRVENRGGPPLPVTILADGEDAVRCDFQASGAVERQADWEAPVTAEQPTSTPPTTRPSNRVRSVVVVDGEPIRLAAAVQVEQPLKVHFDRRRWLAPGVETPFRVTIDNPSSGPVSGTLRITAPQGLTVDRSEVPVELAGDGSASVELRVRASHSGSYRLGAQATLGDLRTKLFEQTLHCAEPGAVFGEVEETVARLVSESLVVEARLQPGHWRIGTDVREAATGDLLMAQDVSLGPPFHPSVVTAATWSARIEDGPTLVLAARPNGLPGITFERLTRLSPSGVVKTWFRATNSGEVERRLEVATYGRPELEGRSGQEAAAPLATGLVLDQRAGWPDWNEPELTLPERFAEGWVAAQAEGYVAATIWREAAEVRCGWNLPLLRTPLAPLPPGGQVESAPTYLYAGPGDWRTVRSLWRQLVAPGAAPEEPTPRPAHGARLERIAFAEAEARTRVLLDSERYRALSGRVSLEVEGREVATGDVEGLKVGEPRGVDVAASLPEAPRALRARVLFDHQRSRESYDLALIRVGSGGREPSVEADGDLVRIDNGRMRLVLQPSQLGRVVEWSVEGTSQLHASPEGPRLFIWFNPWFGGVHPSLHERGSEDFRGKLRHESFSWRQEERQGAQGIAWRGATVVCEPASDGIKGLRLETSYLTTAGSNLLAVVSRLENRSGAVWEGTYGVDAWPAPGGERSQVELHYGHSGERVLKRVPGGMWTASGRWCAVAPASGGPTVAAVASGRARVDVGDFGPEGVLVEARARTEIRAGEAAEHVSYLVLADDVDQARLYRALGDVEGLV